MFVYLLKTSDKVIAFVGLWQFLNFLHCRFDGTELPNSYPVVSAVMMLH